MAGSAGSNFVNSYLLTNVTGGTAVASPLTAYGTIGFNDSASVIVEARGFTKWGFQIVQSTSVAITAGAVTVYGTIDPAAAQTYWGRSTAKGRRALRSASRRT